jgi:hypothetical protein
MAGCTTTTYCLKNQIYLGGHSQDLKDVVQVEAANQRLLALGDEARHQIPVGLKSDKIFKEPLQK